MKQMWFSRPQRPSALAVASALVFALSMVGVSDAFAVKYMSLGQAVKTYIPDGAKIFKTTQKLTPSQKKRLKEDYGWETKEDSYLFYVGKKDDVPVSYVFVVPEVFNTCFHKYAVGMEANGKVIDTAIVELSCPRAFPVNRKSFLKQFKDKTHEDPLTIKADVDAVTGATLSSEATAAATRKAVSLHNLFFGGAKSVAVSAETKAARAKAAGLIQRAIETGETLEKEGKGKGAAQLPSEGER